MLRIVSLLALVQLLIVGCVTHHSEGAAVQFDASTAKAADKCRAEPGSPFDLSSEPPQRQHAFYEWTDANGCLLRVDIIIEYQGAHHCNWQDARMIITGDPLGARFEFPGNAISYVRDPAGVYRDRALADAFDPDATLPDTARDTGYRRGEVELWLDPEDDTALYLKEPAKVERWPRGDFPLCM